MTDTKYFVLYTFNEPICSPNRKLSCKYKTQMRLNFNHQDNDIKSYSTKISVLQ